MILGGLLRRALRLAKLEHTRSLVDISRREAADALATMFESDFVALLNLLARLELAGAGGPRATSHPGDSGIAGNRLGC